MTIRTDITVDFTESPRIITIAAPSVELTLQDLVDTLRSIEDDSSSMDDEHLIDAAGKEALGGGVLVGITATLNNAQVQFEARMTQRDSGTATSIDATGTILTDTAATFQTAGVVRGDVVMNFDDTSAGTVLSVDSETQLTMQPLVGGAENDWDIGENYGIYEIVQVNISGGNLVANDSLGNPISPVFSSANTQVNKTASSSATISANDAADLKLIKQMLAGNATVSLDDLTVTVFDTDGTTVLATFSMSADTRIRTRTS